MRKIIVGAQVSMDGVMQAPGGPWEDPTKGFKFGGWVMPYFDEVFGEEIDRVFKEKCDLLLGRKTYEIFAAYWPYYDETAPAGSIAKLFKTSRSTWFRARATSIRVGRARCCCETSAT
jgi:dihydrofolate reductase